ncbi:MAG: DegV family protein [Alicyclobacillaceae bacterium]|nr:DegV family protein [Alicyclobacillaceae bacterium]
MAKIAFVTDSTACLTKAQAERYGITVVPLSVILDGQSFREGEDLTAAEFYQRLRSSPSVPTTSQPPVGEFAAVFERLLQDHDTVLALLLSSKLSGTFQSAEAAARMVGGDVVVVDSRIASYGIAGPLLDGVELHRRGGGKEEVLALWERELAREKAFFVVDTLEQLHKGGRIGGASAALGSLLQIKPILTMVDGRIELFEKVRTHRRAVERMLEELDRDAAGGKPLKVGVVHADREGDALRLRDQLTQRYPHVQAEVCELGPVIGAHTGPGVLALLYYEPVDGSH